MSNSLFSQQPHGRIEPDLRETVIRVNFLGPAFSFEKGFGSNLTIRPEAGIGSAVYATVKDGKGVSHSQFRSAINPYLLVEIRKYYNLQKRVALGRSVANYAGSYTAFYFRYNAYENVALWKKSDGVVKDVQCFGAWWGFQKNLWPAQLFYLNFSVGPGIKTNWLDYTEGAISFQFGFGMRW